MSQRFGVSVQLEDTCRGHVAKLKLSHIFHGQSLSPLGLKEAHRPFMQFPAELKPDPPFITPPPSFLPLSISAHRPLTTDMCEECVCSPSSPPPPPFFPLCLSSLAHICLLRRLLTHTFSSHFVLTHLSIYFSCHFSGQLAVIRAAATTALGCGDQTTSAGG